MRSNNEGIFSNATIAYRRNPPSLTPCAPMKMVLCVALGLFGACLATAQATDPVGPQQVITLLQQAGYGEVRDLEYDDGLWEAEIRRPYGLWDEVSVEPATGEIFDLRGNRKVLSMRDLLAKLEGQGYRAFTDIDRDAGVWEVEATDPQGRRVDLKVSGYDGRILNSKFDD
ncbi:MAG TPA: PepSY domain-containing protein [Burkholderiaceae bacterium]|nr:PepSY domain-containing protein [Burkholderiaceae bacterium]